MTSDGVISDVIKGTFAMAKHRISRRALQALVLEELKATAGCGGARSVVIETLADEGAPSNWHVGVFDSGTSATGSCRKAIAAIESGLVGRYTAVDDD
jgi:hypothetical protein